MVNLGIGERHFTPADFTETDQEAIAIQFNEPKAGELPDMSNKPTRSESIVHRNDTAPQRGDKNTELDHIIVAPLATWHANHTG